MSHQKVSDSHSDKLKILTKNKEIFNYIFIEMTILQVQINDCEIAFIGGIRGTTYDGYEDGNSDLDYDSSTDDDMVVDIYNHQTNTWRTGPK